jgi:SAM-dependent methyltransferase
MIDLPQANHDSSELFATLYAPIRSRLMLLAIELKVFNLLSEPVTAKEVAQKMATHEENTEHFLNALVACDLVQKMNGKFWNTPVAASFLVEDGPTYLGAALMRSSRNMLSGLDNLPTLVKQGPGEVSTKDHAEDIGSEASQEMWSEFAVPMANYARATARQVVAVISSLPEFPSFGRMLDLGGGPGIYGIAIVSAHPSMKGVVFDQPQVVKVAESFIGEYGLQDRMQVMAGDYSNDPIGSGYDLIWACATLNACKDHMDPLMQKVHAALNPGGVFVCFQDGRSHEGTRPAAMVLPNLCYALMGKDMVFDQGDIADAMFRAGFTSVRSRTLPTPTGAMDLDIGRKPAAA